ncbi:MAG: polyprenyl diphosphate synthase [Gammaproteobacteria bacterium]|nr:polyprenyl diphosphate synthase [Gammaproteobacteria bacterium]MCY4341014.1 polyprenyl diphosphate synthase [Gammaproteobacteria bacterium]
MRHLAIIMDGNGRWALQRGLPRSDGHKAGVEAARRIVEACARRGLPALTLFGLSSENWQRPSSEVSGLMTLLTESLRGHMDLLNDNGIRLRCIGDRRRFSRGIRNALDKAEEGTRGNHRMSLVVALSYGGQQEIAGIARRLALRAARGELDPRGISVEMFARQTGLSDLPPPDLMIRSGGEQRISNFILWHLAYSELHFTPVLWPDFGIGDLEAALDDYAARQRRFGAS